MLPSDDPRPPQRELDVRPAVKHPARPRMKARWRIGFEALQTLRREPGGPSLRPDQLHARVKTAGLKAPAAGEAAFEQPKDPGAPAARAHKKRPRPAIGPAKQRQAHSELVLAKLDGRDLHLFRDVAQGPQSGHRNTRQLVVCGVHSRRNSSCSVKSKKLCFLVCLARRPSRALIERTCQNPPRRQTYIVNRPGGPRSTQSAARRRSAATYARSGARPKADNSCPSLKA